MFRQSLVIYTIGAANQNTFPSPSSHLWTDISKRGLLMLFRSPHCIDARLLNAKTVPTFGRILRNSQQKTSNPGLFCLFRSVIRASRVTRIVTKSLKTKKTEKKNPVNSSNLGNMLSGLYLQFSFMERVQQKQWKYSSVLAVALCLDER